MNKTKLQMIASIWFSAVGSLASLAILWVTEFRQGYFELDFFIIFFAIKYYFSLGRVMVLPKQCVLGFWVAV